ncbi:MAG: FAD-binding protein [Nitrososphaerales archaeon]
MIVGCGAAGLAALVGAAETAISLGMPLGIIALEASDPGNWGGTSRWSGFHLRMTETDQITPNFVEDFLKRSEGKTNESVVRTLAEKAPETIAWISSKGVEFKKKTENVAGGSTIQPKGYGLAVISALRAEAERLGARILFQTKAVRLALDGDGAISGVWVSGPRNAKQVKISCKSVILATGGFAGSPRLLSKYVGKWASTLSVTAPGTKMCNGDGIQMALNIGAKPSGQYDSFQGKPVDARSRMYDPFLQILHFGIVVNQKGERFIDEGAPSGEISDFFNYFGKSIARQPKQLAYLIMDQKLLSKLYSAPIPHQATLVMSDIPPIHAQSIEELAEIIRVPKKALVKTVSTFNNSATGTAEFNPLTKDGKSTSGVSPPKSNWAVAISRPPFICYPVKCSVQFTFGGLAIDPQARIISSRSGKAIPGLYAAGEIVGLHYNRYLPGAIALNTLVFGKLAGSNAIEYVQETSKSPGLELVSTV